MVKHIFFELSLLSRDKNYFAKVSYFICLNITKEDLKYVYPVKILLDDFYVSFTTNDFTSCGSKPLFVDDMVLLRNENYECIFSADKQNAMYKIYYP